jgi:hypothetical protein
MQLDEAVPEVDEIRRQRWGIEHLLSPLLADRGDVIPQRAAARPGYLLRVLEVEAPVGDYFFEDARVKFARLAMKAST